MGSCFQIGLSLSILLLLNLSSVLTNDDDVFVPFEGQRYDIFDWDILKNLDTSHNGNLIMSPLSLKLLMAILYEGVHPQTPTALEMQSALYFSPNISIVRDRFSTIINSLKKPSKSYDLNIESKVYLDSTYNYYDQYPAIVKRYYGVDPEKVNFSDIEKSSNIINKWVNQVTAGKITNMVTEDDLADAVLLLLNAVYFKGQWLYQFPRNQSFMGGFYVSSQQTVTVDFMKNIGQYYYVESTDLDAKMLRLPFKDSTLSMFVILPNSKAGLQRLIKTVNSGLIKKHHWLMDKVNVEVIMPSFKFDFKSKFVKILQKMGLQRIFDNTAHLGKLARGAKRIFVTDILQKAGIEVNEEGSTAYATTEIVLGNKFGTPDYIFNASNPFLFIIEDESTGAAIFIGKVENPVFRDIDPLSADDIPSRFGSMESPVVPLSLTPDWSPPSSNKVTLNQRTFHYFDMELFKAVASRNNENVLISPFSVKQVLAMVLEGADGDCAEELRNALRLPHNQDQIRDLFNNLVNDFSNQENGIIFEVASQIFMNDKVYPVKQYQENLQKYYHSDIRPVNFSMPFKTSGLINDWANRVTHGLIPSLVSSDNIRPETSIILVNALYFKGTWEKSFDAEITRKACFQHPVEECYNTYMMQTYDSFNYVDSRELDAKVLELPYKGGVYSMLIILPNKLNGLPRVLRDLPYEYDNIVKNLEMTEVTVTLPRFSFEYSDDIVRNLEEVKITEIFNEQKANLSHIVTGKNDLYISNVFHKTKIEVNEEGTVAAASTGAVVIPLMGSTNPIFRADHPFVFLIRHMKTGLVLFAGRVTEPEKVSVPQQSEGSRSKQMEHVWNTYRPQFPEAPALLSPSYNKPQQRPITYQYKDTTQQRFGMKKGNVQQDEDDGITFPRKN